MQQACRDNPAWGTNGLMTMRHREVFAAAFCAAFATALSASESASLALTFEGGDNVRLAALSAVASPSLQRPTEGPAWTVSAADAAGAALWKQSLPIPRLFHGDAPGPVFSVIVPEPSAGSTIVLRDENGVTRWTRTITRADLEHADLSLAKSTREIAQAHTAASLQSTAISNALQRQLRADNADRQAREVTTRSTTASSLDERPLLGNPKNAGVLAEATHVVTGHVVANHPIRVRAIDAASNRFVASAEQNWTTGEFAMPLRSGVYIFEADDNLENIDSEFFYRAPTRTQPIRIAADARLPDIARSEAAGEFALRADVPCGMIGINKFLPVWADVWAEDGTHIQRNLYHDALSSDPVGASCEVRYPIRLSPGTYAIEVSPPGWKPVRFEGIRISDRQNASYPARFPLSDRTMVWRGRVVDAARQPAIEAVISMYDELQNPVYTPWTDSEGRFEIAYRKGWSIEFLPPYWYAREGSVRRLYLIDGRPLPSEVVIEDIDVTSATEGPLLRLYGDGNRLDRFNILFLADGYTDVRESYTDVNGNGVWDGYVWNDLDHDGVLSPADDNMFYGSPAHFPPVPGSVPTKDNEPFIDLNGDGILSLDDPSLFLLNARAFLRSLFGSDVWDAHRDAFNAYALFEPSQQAGYSVISASEEKLVTRSTRYKATLKQGRNLMSIDYAAAMNRALAVLPTADLVVVLVNEPIRKGRANATVGQPGLIVYPSGPFNTWIDQMTASHEMAHLIGSLCDEYEEYEGTYPLSGTSSSRCPNVSYSSNAVDTPWLAWIATDANIPSRNLDGSIGLYEGAAYYSSGAYRPSYTSTMRSLSPLFNAPSRAALEHAIERRSGLNPLSARSRIPPLIPSRVRKQSPL
jgi:hypothetical protein